MILRVNEDGSVVIIKSVNAEQEEEFMRLNSGGKIKFIRVDKLPNTRYGCLRYKNNKLVPDIECIKKKMIEELNAYTEKYISNRIEQLGEDLIDIVSEAQVIEGRVLHIAAKNGLQVTTDTIKQRVAEYIAGKDTGFINFFGAITMLSLFSIFRTDYSVGNMIFFIISLLITVTLFILINKRNEKRVNLFHSRLETFIDNNYIKINEA